MLLWTSRAVHGHINNVLEGIMHGNDPPGTLDETDKNFFLYMFNRIMVAEVVG